MQYGIHEVLTNCSEPLLLSLLQGCCDSRLLCLPNAMSSFTQYTYVDRTRPPEHEISSPRKPRITSKFLFEFKEKSRKTSPMNVARLITPGGQNALRPLLLELVNNLQILSIYTEPFFVGVVVGKLPDGWERSETTNGIPYYIKYVWHTSYSHPLHFDKISLTSSSQIE